MQTSDQTVRLSIFPAERKGEFFTSLSAEALCDFESLELLLSYPAAKTLFLEGQKAADVLILVAGEVKLSISSSNGKRLILRIAQPGDFLGLASALAGNPYRMTAEALYQCCVAVLPRFDFLDFLIRHPDARQSMANAHRACERLRTVGLASSAPAKVALLLLEWSANGRLTERGTRIHISLTHGEIGEHIGVSRETVTRTLNKFRRRHLVDMQGSILTILNRPALESCAGI
jgi:CRP/FNR family transcriptional regulator